MSSPAAAHHEEHRLPTVFDASSNTTTHPTTASPHATEVWRHDAPLGTGSFASVRRETNDTTGAVRAVKLVSKTALALCGVDFHAELGVLLAVKDRPEFVSFVGWFEDPDHVFFAMEFVAHGDLEDLMGLHPSLAQRAVKTIAQQLLRGLCILQGQRICHRDIKPKNILIASMDPLRCKIADFGLSTLDPAVPLPYGCGTKRYQAPELMRFLHAPCLPRPRERFPFAADVWAVGVVVYTVVTGTNPFFAPKEGERGDEMNGSWGITTGNLRALQRYCAGAGLEERPLREGGVGGAGVALVRAMLRPDPGRRITAQEAVRDVWLVGRSASIGSRVRMALGMGGAGMKLRGA